jgi:hypothetical protein
MAEILWEIRFVDMAKRILAELALVPKSPVASQGFNP